MIAASKVIIGEPPETPSLFSPKLALFDGIAWRARSCVWKKKNGKVEKKILVNIKINDVHPDQTGISR